VPVLQRDAELHYDDIGEGPPVVLVHGVTSTGSLEWRGVVGTLADDYRCITPDLRGHGRSGLGTAPLTIATLSGDLLALVEDLELKQPHLVGFSMGSHTVLRAVLAQPDLPASVTFIGYSSGRPPEYPQPAGDVLPPGDWPVALRRAQAHHGEDHWRALYTELSNDWMREAEHSAEDLRAITCPVLVVLGAGEPEFKHRQARDLAAALPHARVESIAGADHPVHQQQAFVVNRLVHEFIATAERELAQ